MLPGHNKQQEEYDYTILLYCVVLRRMTRVV